MSCGHIHRYKICNTCSRTESDDVKLFRKFLYFIFDKQFSVYSPDWAVNPKNNRKLLFIFYNQELMINFDLTSGKKAIREIKQKLCQDNGVLYLRIYRHDIMRLDKYINIIKKPPLFQKQTKNRKTCYQ